MLALGYKKKKRKKGSTHKLKLGLDAFQDETHAARRQEAFPACSLLGAAALGVGERPIYPCRFGVAVVHDVVDVSCGTMGWSDDHVPFPMAIFVAGAVQGRSRLGEVREIIPYVEFSKPDTILRSYNQEVYTWVLLTMLS